MRAAIRDARLGPFVNLVKNPAMVSTFSSVEVARNLVTNPAVEATSGTVEVRRNLNRFPTPSVSSTSWGYLGGVTRVSKPEINATDIEFPASISSTESIVGGYTASHRTHIEAGQSVVVAWDLENLSPHPVELRHLVILYRDDSTINWALTLNVFTLAAGERRVVAYETPSNELGGSLRLDIRHGASASDTSPIPGTVIRLHDGLTIEDPATFAGTTFSGDLPSPDPDLTPSWTGPVNASGSVLTGARVAGITTPTEANGLPGYATSDNPFSGNYSARFVILREASAVGVPVPTASLPQDTLTTIMFRARASHTLTGVEVRQGAPHPEPIDLPAGEWVDVRRTSVRSGTGLSQGLLIRSGSGVVPGMTIDIDEVMLTEGEYNGPYFDGDTSPDPDLTASWEGPAGGSTSVLTGQRVADIHSPTADQVAPAFRVTGGPEGATHFARFRVLRKNAIAFPTGNVNPPTGELTTLLAWIRAPRDYTRTQMRISGAVSERFDLPANEWVQKRATIEAGTSPASAVTTGFRFETDGGHEPGDLIDVALVMLTGGEYDGPYLDGDSPRCVWMGVAHQSPSVGYPALS